MTTHKEALTRITRDDTEHGKEYYLASDVDALLAQPEHDCTRSHPHEEMSKECELRTEIARLRNQLAQPEQKHVANYCKECLTYNGHQEACSHYTTTPQRTWVGLTPQERDEITNTVMIDIWQVARAIEAKLKEKNT